MKFTRILALLLALVMVLACFAACNKDENPDDSEEEEEGEEENITLKMIDQGLTDYVIVRDYNASQKVISAVNEMVDFIKTNIGATIAVKECFNDRVNEPLDVISDKEILVGVTNREESIEALKDMRSKDYTISIHGSKLVLGGSGEAGTLAAIALFMNSYIAEQGDRFAVRNGENQSLEVTTKTSLNYKANYSYNSAKMLDVRIDSFGLIYPKVADNTLECQAFANDLSAYITNETGYTLEVYRDSAYWCDYEILIGETVRTDEAYYAELGDDEYYIKLIKTEVTYEDESKHPGGKLIICFGRDAKDAALEAFKSKILPVLQTPGDFALADGFELTNKQ